MISTILWGLLATTQAGEISVTEKGHVNNPIWSADGKKIAFEINAQAGDISLFVAKVDGVSMSGSPEKILLGAQKSSFGGGGGTIAAPTWHPNGTLFFTGAYKGESNRIYMNAFNGTPSRALISEKDSPGDLSWPTVSNDGSNIVFVSDATGMGDVYSYNLTKWKLQPLVQSEHSEMAPRYDDSGKVIYTRKRNEGEDVFLYDGSASSDWVGGAGDQTRPNWADSGVVFFSSERGGDNWDIVVSVAPGKKKTLAKSVRLPFRAPPALSPDGTWVVYGLEHPDKSNSVWATKIDGSKTVELKTAHEACGEPALTSVDGKIYLAYTALPSEGSDWRQLHVMDVTSKLQ